MTKYNEVKKNTSILKLGMITQQKEESQVQHNSQKPTCSHSQEFHKITKLIACVCVCVHVHRGHVVDPCRPCACFFCPCEHI